MLVDDVELVLATIRQIESGEHYTAPPNRARASGAYQYIPSTWNNFGGYAEAYLAPPEVQDSRARADVERFLAMYDGDVSSIPVMWYYPRAAVDGLWMDRVPNPAGGNRLTIREYQTRWLERLATNASAALGTFVREPATPAPVSVLSEIPALKTESVPVDPSAAQPAEVSPPAAHVDRAPTVDRSATADRAPTADRSATADAPPVVLDAVTVSAPTMDLAARSIPPAPEDRTEPGSMRSIVFPVLGPTIYADGWGDPRDGGRRSHQGTDIIGVQMQPVLAAVDGVVTRVQHSSVGISGVALAITDADGWRYNYFHGNNDTPGTDDDEAADAFRIAPGLEFGDEVVAGQIIGYLGDSGNAELSVAHLHFEFRDPSGRARPSYWSLRAAEARQACAIGIGPWSTPLVPADEPAAAELDPSADTALATVERATVERATVERAVPVVEHTVERAVPVVEHTVVTPLFGDGQWIIDSEGRVTATGDAALIVPRRDLQCDPGPSAPFGTEAGGWGALGHDVLEGTVLAGADLTGTVLDGVIPDPPAAMQDAPVIDDATPDPSSSRPNPVAGIVSAGGGSDIVEPPLVFDLPATGETVIVLPDVSPEPPIPHTPSRPSRPGPR